MDGMHGGGGGGEGKKREAVNRAGTEGLANSFLWVESALIPPLAREALGLTRFLIIVCNIISHLGWIPGRWCRWTMGEGTERVLGCGCMVNGRKVWNETSRSVCFNNQVCSRSISLGRQVE